MGGGVALADAGNTDAAVVVDGATMLTADAGSGGGTNRLPNVLQQCCSLR